MSPAVLTALVTAPPPCPLPPAPLPVPLLGPPAPVPLPAEPAPDVSALPVLDARGAGNFESGSLAGRAITARGTAFLPSAPLLPAGSGAVGV